MIPAELANLPYWVCWKWATDKKGKKTKPPINPKTGKYCGPNDAGAYGPIDAAIAAVEKYGLDGIGFAFTGAGFFGVDLDHIGEPGYFSVQEADEITRALNSYTELSPSGTGRHILCRGSLPRDGLKRDEMEMYSNGRYLTVTGKHLEGTPTSINHAGDIGKSLAYKYFADRFADKTTPQDGTAAQSAMAPVLDSDADIIQRASKARNGTKFTALWNGNYQAYYGSQSEADIALCRMLSFWTAKDATKIDVLFRLSGLMRPKWNEKHGQNTYGATTIEKAIAQTTAVYEPHQAETNVITGAKPPVYEHDLPADDNPRPDGALLYLNDLLLADIAKFKQYRDRKTGFSNLDQYTTGLYPGLYGIGAISSLGKTTFIHQMGDQLAEAGEHVIFFSLEQSRFEMVSKSLARETAKANIDTAISAIAIRGGKGGQAVINAAKKYSSYADHISIVECNFNATTDFMFEYVKKYMAANKDDSGNPIKPVVIIDYLQIISPPMDAPGMDVRSKIDNAMHALKKFQSENDLVVIIISAFNRANYMQPVDFESFKESSGIEYSCDVLWGMQLQILNDELFYKKEKVKEKRDKIKQAKAENPRKIELICLKNRYGKTGYICYFKYDAEHDYFTVDQDTEFDWDDIVFPDEHKKEV
jgi:replicative DNA helicase